MGSLPPGLTLNQLGVLSGVPKVEGNFTFTVQYYKSNKREVHDSSPPITIRVVKVSPPTITTTSPLSPGQMDVPYVLDLQRFRAENGVRFLPTPDKPTGYNWSLSWGKIPTGMTFNTVGALSGIPRLDPKLSGNFTQNQTFTFNITATDAVLGNNTKTFTLTIKPPVPPTIVTDCPLPEGLELYPYANVYLKATSGKKEYKWSVGNSTNFPLPEGAFNRFPDGLKLSLAGTISGKPTLPGLFVFRLKVTDANGLTAEKECRITIMPAPEPPKYCFLCLYEGDYRCFPGTTRGGLPPYTWTATGLPPGLSINSSTGEVCGTCLNSGTYETNITVKESSRGGTATSTFTIVVMPKLEITTNSPLPWGIVGRSYPTTASLSPVKIEAIGGWSSSKKWIVLFGKLPDDLKLDPDTGIIYGTPSKKGTYKFTIRVQDECKPSSPSLECDDSPRIKYVDKEFVIDIYDPITLPTPPIPCLTVNKPFSTTLTASGGKGDLTWLIISVSSPAYNIASSVGKTATLEGTPSISGPVTLKIRVTDENLDSEDFTLNYSAFSEVKITSGCPPSEWTSGKPITPLKLTATGGSGEYTWSKYDDINNPWPTGLVIESDQIQGTPVVSITKNYTIAYQVTDSCRNTDNKTCQIIIYPPLTCNQTISLPCLYNGMTLPETVAFSATGGKPPYVDWELTPIGSSKALPNGLLQKKPPNGVGNGSALYGTITENGTYNFTATVTDSLGNKCSKNHTIAVYPKLEITNSCPLATGTNGTAYTANLTATGGKLGYTWSLLPPSSLPPDLVLNPNTGKITGTPKVVGNFSFTYMVSDNCTQEATKNCTIEIKEFTSLCAGVTVIQICNENAAKDDNFDIHLNNEKIGDVDLSQNKQIGSLFIAHPTATITSGDFKCPIGSMVIHSFDEKLVKTGANSLKMLNTKNNNSGNYGIIEIRSYKFDGTVLSDPRVISDVTYSGRSGANITPPDFSYTCPEDTSSSSLAFAEVFSSAKVLGENEEYNMVAVAFNPSAMSANPEGLKINSLLKASNFKIGDFEITTQQYADFLNVAAKTDPNNLYNPQMSHVGIQKSSNNGTVSYTIDAGLEDYPVTYVSWFDAARYANWMANGKPSGSQGPTTTENGAYNLAASTIIRNAINPNTEAPPTFWLLNESEWYTSAYLKSDATALWAYPTQSNTAPDANGSNPANLANFGSAFDGTTPVGFFDRSPGPFGTFDQAGNVREWTESLDTSSGAPVRIIRGGSWADPASSMRADESHVADPTLKDDKTGFRIGGAP